MSHIEEHQYLKDLSYIQAERDFLYWQEYFDEMETARREHQKPAKINVMYEGKVINHDRIKADTLPF